MLCASSSSVTCAITGRLTRLSRSAMRVASRHIWATLDVKTGSGGARRRRAAFGKSWRAKAVRRLGQKIIMAAVSILQHAWRSSKARRTAAKRRKNRVPGGRRERQCFCARISPCRYLLGIMNHSRAAAGSVAVAWRSRGIAAAAA